MDFVVAGFGIGALAVLIGLTLHDLGPTWRRLRPTLPYPPVEAARRIAWGRGCRATGRVVALAGVTLCLITLLALVSQLSDRAGAVTIMIALTLILTGLLTWAAFYAHRFHPRSRPRRPGRTAPGDASAPGRDAPVGASSDAVWEHDPSPALLDPFPPGIESDQPALTDPGDHHLPDRAAGDSDDDRQGIARQSDEPKVVSDDAAVPLAAQPGDSASAHYDARSDKLTPNEDATVATRHSAEPPGIASADTDESGAESPTGEQDAPSLTPAGKAH